MIRITRAQARQLRAVLRKSAPIGSARNYRPLLVFQAGNDGLHVRFDYTDIAAEWHIPGTQARESIILAGKALDDFEGSQEVDVALTLQGTDAVQARWQDGGVPQSREYVTVGSDRLAPFPEAPNKFVSMDAAILKALEDAAQTVGSDSTRFGLTRVQLRGKTGEIVSSDGRQLLLQRGFAFPWKEDFLVPALGVFGCREFVHDGSVAIGKSEKYVCLRVGPWTFHLLIDQNARFPRIEQAIPAHFTKGSSFQMAPEDASFLAQALPRLPGNDDDHEKVTVDLNGHVAVRAQAEGQTEVTELLLSRSQATGPPTRFVSDRQFLARALRLGFTEFHVARPDVPIVCRDRQRLFVWMPLDHKSAIPPTAAAGRIESVASAEPVSQQPVAPRRTKTMPAPTSNGHATNGSPNPNPDRSERNLGIVELIAEAEELRTVLLDGSTRLARLLSALKQHRRQSRAVQAAMQSLKQLQLDG